jgi:hypothetical protein
MNMGMEGEREVGAEKQAPFFSNNHLEKIHSLFDPQA